QTPPGPSSEGPGPQPGVTGPGGQPPAPAPQQAEKGDPRLRDLARWFEKRMGSVGESPEFQRALKELGQARAGDGKLSPELARLQKLFEHTASAVERDLRNMERPHWAAIDTRGWG